MNYAQYNIEDFVLDDGFVAWVKHNKNHQFWIDFVSANPHQKNTIENARQIILAASTLPVAEISPARKLSIKENIYQSINTVQDDYEEDPGTLSHSRNWKWIAAAAVLIIGSFLWFNYSQSKAGITYEKLLANVKPDKIKEISNTTGQSMLVNLPDGSSVLLQKDGKLSYNTEEYNKLKREIFLSGEAFFEVSKNPEKPFFVYANELVTKVLGTSFTIRAFNDEKVEVIVKTGKVSVFTINDPEKHIKLSNRELDGVVLLPNQQIMLDREDLRLSKSLVDNPELLSLSAQKLSFVFDDVPVSEIMSTIEKAYGVKIVYDEELLDGCKVTAHLTDEPLYDKIHLLCQALNASYEVIDGVIVLHTKGCK